MKSFRDDDSEFRAQGATENPSSPTVQAFRFGREFWNWVQADPLLQEELNQRISEKLNTRFETMKRDFDRELEEKERKQMESAERQGRQDGFEFGKKQGLEEAFEAGKNELITTIDALRGLARKIVDQQSHVISSQETTWLSVLEYVLKQCLVPRPAAVIEGVRQWLITELGDFNKEKMVRVAVPSGLLSRYQGALSQAPIDNLGLVADDSLRSGDVRVTCDNGGLLFSDEQALEKLRDIIHLVNAVHD